MAKRSREDFEPLPLVPGTLEGPTASSLSIHSAGTNSQTSSSKIIQLDSPSGEAHRATEMRCSLPPHRQTLLFASYEEYEIHYNKAHVNRCMECRKNFPTEHYLNLHIEENHDALVSVRRERGEKTYSCFVEDCEKTCSTPQKRRMHLIDKHLFPKDYDFYVINDGIDHRSSLLRTGRQRRRSSAAQLSADIEGRARRRSSALEGATEGGKQDQSEGIAGSLAESTTITPPGSQEDDNHDMEGLTGAMSALKFIPPSVRFGRGRGRGRGGFSRT